MEDPNSTLLPYILESLSQKKDLSDTVENLLVDIEAQLAEEHVTKYGNVRDALERALNAGQSLGIITLSQETIRVPFNLRPNNPTHNQFRHSLSDYEISVPGRSRKPRQKRPAREKTLRRRCNNKSARNRRNFRGANSRRKRHTRSRLGGKRSKRHSSRRC